MKTARLRMRMGSMDAWIDVASATECTMECTMVRKYTYSYYRARRGRENMSDIM